MNQQAYKKSFVIGAVAIGVIAGVAVGFFTAHRMMGHGCLGFSSAGRRLTWKQEASRRLQGGRVR